MPTQATAAAKLQKGDVLDFTGPAIGRTDIVTFWVATVVRVDERAAYLDNGVKVGRSIKDGKAKHWGKCEDTYNVNTPGAVETPRVVPTPAPAEAARPNPVSAVVSVNPASPYAKYNGARFSVQQVNGPVEKLVFCLNIEGVFTDFAQAELTAFWYDESAGAKPVVRVPLTVPAKVSEAAASMAKMGTALAAIPEAMRPLIDQAAAYQHKQASEAKLAETTELQSLTAEEMAAGLEVFTRRAGTDNTVNRLNLDNYERKQLDKLVNAGYAKSTFVAGQYELVASAAELADAEIHELIGEVMTAQAAVTRSETELVRVGEGHITAPAIRAALRTQRAALKELQNRVNWIKTQRNAPAKATAPETPPAPVEAPYTLEKFYALLRKLGTLDIVPVARVPKFIRPAFLKWLNVTGQITNVDTSIYKAWAAGVLHDRELASKYIFRK